MRPSVRVRAGLPYLVVLAGGAFLYRTADRLDAAAGPGGIGPGTWPKLVLAVMLLAALWGFVASTFGIRKTAAEQTADVTEIEALLRPPELYPHLVWLAVLATFGYLLLLPLAGFFLATIIYTLVLLHLGHYRRLLRGLALSVVVAFAFMFLFMRVVYVSLPRGIAPFDHLSFVVMAALGVR